MPDWWMDRWMDGWKVASSDCLPACQVRQTTWHCHIRHCGATCDNMAQTVCCLWWHSKCKNRHPTVPAAMQFTLEYKMLEAERESGRGRERSFSKNAKNITAAATASPELESFPIRNMLKTPSQSQSQSIAIAHINWKFLTQNESTAIVRTACVPGHW